MSLSDAEILILRKKLEDKNYMNTAIQSVAGDIVEGKSSIYQKLRKMSPMPIGEQMPVEDKAEEKSKTVERIFDDINKAVEIMKKTRREIRSNDNYVI